MNSWSAGPGIVEFPNGVRVRGAGWRRRNEVTPAPDFALVLLGRPPSETPWPTRWVRWPDFGLPRSTDDAVAALSQASDRARDGRVAIMCGSGIGRTGTAIAVLAALSGVAPEEAVAWTRAHYHRRAVETPWQRRWLLASAANMAG